MIFSISGRAGAGKDTVGKLIQWYFYKERAKQIPALSKNQEALLSLNNWLSLGIAEVEASQSGWKIVKWATALRQVAAILLSMPEEFLYTDEFKQMVLPEQWNVYKVFWTFVKTPDGIFSTYEAAYKHLINIGGKGYAEESIKKYSMTGREFLQKLGTDAIRNGLHPQTWVNALMSKYKPSQGDNWIITDTRFPNEDDATKQAGAVRIRVNRFFYWHENERHIFSDREDRTGLVVTVNSDVYLKDEALSKFKTAAKFHYHPSETALDDAEFDFTIDNTGSIDQLAEQVKVIVQSTLKSNENANSRISSEDNDIEVQSRTEE